MRKKFSKLDKDEMLILGGAGFLLLLVAVLAALLVSVTNARENVLLQYEAEHALTDFLFRIQQDNAEAEQMLSENGSVRGLAVYTYSGEQVVGIGDVPKTLDVSSYNLEGGKQAQYNRTSKTIEYVRRAKISLTAARIDPEPLEKPLEQFELPFAELLYISFDGSDYHARLIWGWALVSFLIVLMVGAFVLVFRIYTRNRQYREKLAQQENLVSMGEAARTLAHEIKNPLSAISLQSAVLKKTIPPEHYKDVEVIEQEVRRLNVLTKRIGDFLRNPLGEPKQLDLEQFIRELVSKFDVEIPCRKTKEGQTFVEIDPERARSVFENLINNALESCSEKEDGSADVSIEVTPEKEYIVVRVLDRGKGLPEGGEKQLFDPFFTTKAKGSGIGLAITRRFILAAGGNIRMHSRSGGGTIASVELPRSAKT
ncbi:MAG: sensor histidine kinase [Spirochaetota bacterium]